jgi:hypothetical protein
MRGRGREIIKIIESKKKKTLPARNAGEGEGEGTRPSRRWWVFLASLVVRNPHNPPHEQLLVRLGRVVCRRSSSLLFHPRSTPRAVAREAGGGWCVVPSLSSLFPVVSFRFPFPPVVSSSSSSFRFSPPCRFVVPAIHPASEWLAGEGRGPFRRRRLVPPGRRHRRSL